MVRLRGSWSTANTWSGVGQGPSTCNKIVSDFGEIRWFTLFYRFLPQDMRLMDACLPPDRPNPPSLGYPVSFIKVPMPFLEHQSVKKSSLSREFRAYLFYSFSLNFWSWASGFVMDGLNSVRWSSCAWLRELAAEFSRRSWGVKKNRNEHLWAGA